MYGNLETYFFVELELWHGLVDLVQTEVLEEQEAWRTERTHLRVISLLNNRLSRLKHIRIS